MRRPRFPFSHPSLPWLLFCGLMLVFCVAGGASRADVAGQAVIRGAAALAIGATLLSGAPLSFRRVRPVIVFLVAAIALVLLQLVPLPPGLWALLPGRSAFVATDLAAGGPPPWRPLAIAPSLAVNALYSLLVPVATLIVFCGLSAEERARVPALLLILVGASTLLAVLQFSGAGFASPLVNNVRSETSGFFANRNHFTLFVAQGCLLLPAWVVAPGGGTLRRVPAGIGLLVVFLLVNLASGSRAGLLLSGVAVLVVALMSFREIRRFRGSGARWIRLAMLAGVVVLIALVVGISVLAGRAVAIDRAVALDAGSDIRRRALPTVLEMITDYFPAGSGFGGFDAVFRLHEPFALLKPTYFNHAHDDWLEVVLTGGLPALLLLVAAVGWWAWRSVLTWRAGTPQPLLPRLGSAMLLLVMIASVTDYPARTPMIMAVIIIAASWLAGGPGEMLPSALPRREQHL